MAEVAARVGDQVTRIRVLAQSGVVRPYAPLTLARLGKTLLDWGVGSAGGFAALALRSPHRVGFIDEIGPLTYQELDERGRALADSLRHLGVGAGDGVAIMVRNHRGFIDASIAGARLGADLLYLNTAFAGPQLVEVLEREGPKVVVYDQEFSPLLEEAPGDVQRIVAWADGDTDDIPVLEELIAKGSLDTELRAPERASRVVILTSGTTGTPKGAPREAGIDAAVALLSRMPMRRGWTCHVAAPLFHTWGWAHLAMSMLLETTLVVRRTFDPEGCLEVVAEHRCDSLVVIPVMLQRILALPEETRSSYDLSQVKVVAASGSALPGDLGIEWMDQFGDTLYNTYGSTEVAYATIATPQDLREAPGTAGRPPYGTVVKIYDDNGEEVPRGGTGRIFVGNTMLLFEGYTSGGHKDLIDGLMASGDVGRFDEAGRLHVEGRDDEMIVSGGENVFPQEVEDCLSRHGAVSEAAAIGVDDPDYGKRLKAFVVLESGKDASVDDLKEHVRAHLARYKVPREVVLVPELPRNATGKVLKRDLGKRGTGGTDDPDRAPLAGAAG